MWRPERVCLHASHSLHTCGQPDRPPVSVILHEGFCLRHLYTYVQMRHHNAAGNAAHANGNILTMAWVHPVVVYVTLGHYGV